MVNFYSPRAYHRELHVVDILRGASSVVQWVNNPPAMQETQETGSILGLERSPGEGNGNPFQYSCLVNARDRGAWQATIHGVAKSQTRLSD